MLISSKGRYALRLMIYIAAFGDEEGKIALREVAEREDISLKYLEQLVRPLMQAGRKRCAPATSCARRRARPRPLPVRESRGPAIGPICAPR